MLQTLHCFQLLLLLPLTAVSTELLEFASSLSWIPLLFRPKMLHVKNHHRRKFVHSGSSVSKIFLYSFDFSDSDYICYKPTKLFIKNHLFHCTSHVGFNRDDDENPSHGRSKLLSSRTNSLVGIAADSRSFGTLNLVGLLAERASLREPGLSTRGLAQDRRTTGANYDALGMAEHGRDFVASGALDVHEVRVRMGHQALQLMLALLLGRKRVQEILGERHSETFVFYTCSETRVLEA